MGISITRLCVNYGGGSTAEEILKASFARKFRRFICSIAVLLIIPTNMLMAQNDISWLLLKATFAWRRSNPDTSPISQSRSRRSRRSSPFPH
jgi:hypothetical protein